MLAHNHLFHLSKLKFFTIKICKIYIKSNDLNASRISTSFELYVVNKDVFFLNMWQLSRLMQFTMQKTEFYLRF